MANIRFGCASGSISSQGEFPDSVLCMLQGPAKTDPDSVKKFLLESHFSDLERIVCNTSGSYRWGQLNKEKLVRLQRIFFKAFKVEDSDKTQAWQSYCSFIDRAGDKLRSEHCRVPEEVIHRVAHDCGHDIFHIIQQLSRHILNDNERTFFNSSGTDGFQPLPEHKLDALRDAFLRIYKLPLACEQEVWSSCLKQIDTEALVRRTQYMEKLFPHWKSDLASVKPTESIPTRTVSLSPSTEHVREYGGTCNGETNQISETRNAPDIEVLEVCKVKSISSLAVEEYEEKPVTTTQNPASSGSQSHMTPQMHSKDVLSEGNRTDLSIGPSSEYGVMSSKRKMLEDTNNEAKKQMINSAIENQSQASRQGLPEIAMNALLQLAQSGTNCSTDAAPTILSKAYPAPEKNIPQNLPSTFGAGQVSVQEQDLATLSQSVVESVSAPQTTSSSHFSNSVNSSHMSQSLQVPTPVTLHTANITDYPRLEISQLMSPIQRPVTPGYQGSQPHTPYVLVSGTGTVQRPSFQSQPTTVTVLPYPPGNFQGMNALPPPQASLIQNWQGPVLESHAHSGAVSNLVCAGPSQGVRLSGAGLPSVNVAISPSGTSLILVNPNPRTEIPAPSVQNVASSPIPTGTTAVSKQMEYSIDEKLETSRRKRKAHFEERAEFCKKGKNVHSEEEDEEVETNQTVQTEAEIMAEDILVQKLQAVSGHKLYVVVEIVKHCVGALHSFNILARKLTKRQFRVFKRLYARVYKIKLKKHADVQHLKKLINEVCSLPLHQFGIEEAKEVHEAVVSLASVGLSACQKVNKLAAVLFSEEERTYSSPTGSSSYPPFCKSRLFVLCHAYFAVTRCQWYKQSREACNVRTMLYRTAKERRLQSRLRNQLGNDEDCFMSPHQYEESNLQRKQDGLVSSNRDTGHAETTGHFMEEHELGAYVMSHADYCRMKELFPFPVSSRRKALEVLTVAVLSTEELLLCANKASTNDRSDMPVKFAFLRQAFFLLFPQAYGRHCLEWRLCSMVLSDILLRIEEEACKVQCLAFPVKVKLLRPGLMMGSNSVKEEKQTEETGVPPQELRLPESANGPVNNLGAYVIDHVIALHLDIVKNHPSEESREDILKHIIKKVIADDRHSNSVQDIQVYLALLRQCFSWTFPDESDALWARRWDQGVDYVKRIVERQEDCVWERPLLMPQMVSPSNIKREDTDESTSLVFGATCPVDRLGATVSTSEELSEIDNIWSNLSGSEESYAKKAAIMLLLSKLFKEDDLAAIPIFMALSGLPCTVSKLTRLRYAFFWLFPQSTLEQVSIEWAWCWAQVNNVLRGMLQKDKSLTAKLSVPHMASVKLSSSENKWDPELMPFFVFSEAVEPELTHHHFMKTLNSGRSTLKTYKHVKYLHNGTMQFHKLGSYVMTAQEAAWTENFRRKCWREKLQRMQVLTLIVQSLYTKSEVVHLYHLKLSKKKVFCEMKMAILCQVYHLVFPPETPHATKKSWHTCWEILQHVCRILKDKAIKSGLLQPKQRPSRRKERKVGAQDQKLLEAQDQKLLEAHGMEMQSKMQKPLQKSHVMEGEIIRSLKKGVPTISRCEEGMTETDKHRRMKRDVETQQQKSLEAQSMQEWSKVDKTLEKSHEMESETNRSLKKDIPTSSKCEERKTETNRHRRMERRVEAQQQKLLEGQRIEEQSKVDKPLSLPLQNPFHPGFVKLLEHFSWDVKIVMKLMMRNLFEEDELLEYASDANSALNDGKFLTCYTTFCDIFGLVERSIFTTLVRHILHELSRQESSSLWDRWTDKQEQGQVKKCARLTAYSTSGERAVHGKKMTTRLCKGILGVNAHRLPARKIDRCKYIANKLLTLFFSQEERLACSMTGLQGMCHFDPRRIAVLKHVTFTLARVSPSQRVATWKKFHNDIGTDSHQDVNAHFKKDRQVPPKCVGTDSNIGKKQLSSRCDRTGTTQALLELPEALMQELSQSNENPSEVLKKLMAHLLPCTDGQYRSSLCVSEKMIVIREAFWNICKITESRQEETWNTALKNVWRDQVLSISTIPVVKPGSLSNQDSKESSSPNQLVQEESVSVQIECQPVVSIEDDDNAVESSAYAGPCKNTEKATEEYVLKSVLACVHEHVRTGCMHQDEVIDELIWYIFSGDELLEFPSGEQLMSSHRTEALKAAVSELYKATEDTMKSLEKLIEDRLISAQNNVKTQLKWIVGFSHEKDEGNSVMSYPQMQNLSDRVNEMRSLLMTHVTAADRINIVNGDFKQLKVKKAKIVMDAFQRYCRKTGEELERKDVMILIYNLTVELQDIVKRSFKHKMDIAVDTYVAQTVSNLEKKAEMLNNDQSASPKVLFESVLRELIEVFQTAGLVPTVRVLVNYLFTHDDQLVLAYSSASEWQRVLGIQINLLERTVLKVIKTPSNYRENVWSCITWIISQEVTNVHPAKFLKQNSLFPVLAPVYCREAVRKCVLEAFLTAEEREEFWVNPQHFEKTYARSVSQMKNMYFLIRNTASHDQVQEWELVCTRAMHEEGVIALDNDRAADDKILPDQESQIVSDNPAVQMSLEKEVGSIKLPSKGCDGEDSHMKDDDMRIVEQRLDESVTASTAGAIIPSHERTIPHTEVCDEGNNNISSDNEGTCHMAGERMENQRMPSAGVNVEECADSDMQTCFQDKTAVDATPDVSEGEQIVEDDIVDTCTVSTTDTMKNDNDTMNSMECEEQEKMPPAEGNVTKCAESDMQTCFKDETVVDTTCVSEEEQIEEEDILDTCRVPSADDDTCEEATHANDTPTSAVSVQRVAEVDWESCVKVFDMID
ncbi:uncharacterized protein [Diadema antillarum]|uniref:uncharacterized protein n=1 Tax=Diadema antillarum TaxID=105358 RepID=UPI003A881B10